MAPPPAHARTRARTRTLIRAEDEAIDRFDTMHKRMHPMVFREWAPPDGLFDLLHDLVAASGDASRTFLSLAGNEQYATMNRTR